MSDKSSNPFTAGFPGFAPMMEQMESFRKLWSSMDVPSRLVPTLDIGELDKRIADLKAVEQWLNLNLGMLRGTIQGLEIQRGTLAAVQAFGSAFQGQGMAAGPLNPSAAGEWSKPRAESAEPSAATPGASASTKASTATKASAAPTAASAAIDPSAWWSLLQNNFQQIAQAALAGSQLPGTPRAASSASGKTAANRKTGPASGKTGASPAARKSTRGR